MCPSFRGRPDLEPLGVFMGVFLQIRKTLSIFFGLKGCGEWNRQYRAMGLGNYLVRRCPGQMRGCAQVAGRGPHSEHDKICPANPEPPAVCNQPVDQIGLGSG